MERDRKQADRTVLQVIEQAAGVKKPHRVTLPMGNERRLANYQAQNARDGRKELTPGQRRQLARADTTRPARPVKQHFATRTQYKPSGRTGSKRWGPQMTLKGLSDLLFRSRTTVKGIGGTGEAATVASQRGRIAARTGHGRRRQNRGSRRNG